MQEGSLLLFISPAEELELSTALAIEEERVWAQVSHEKGEEPEQAFISFCHALNTLSTRHHRFSSM